MSDKNEKIGALWVKESEKGDFFTGIIKDDNGNDYRIVIFKNGYKNNEKQPDYNIYKSKTKEAGSVENEVVEDNNEDDDTLPF